MQSSIQFRSVVRDTKHADVQVGMNPPLCFHFMYSKKRSWRRGGINCEMVEVGVDSDNYMEQSRP
jgi:hypothetical protein